MATTQIRGNTQIKAGTILDAQISANAAIATSKLAEGAELVKRDGSVAMIGNLNMQDNSIDFADGAASLLVGFSGGEATINLNSNAALLSVTGGAAEIQVNGDGNEQAYMRPLQVQVSSDGGSASMIGDALGGRVELIKATQSGIEPGPVTELYHATHKKYVDDLDALNVRLDGTRAMSGNLNLDSNRITNLADPVSASDAANKGYVDSVAQGLDVKLSVRVATTANITLSGLQAVDGVALAAGNRVLVKNQDNAIENGIYVAAAGAWARAEDMNTSAELTAGAFTFVEEGNVNADSGWVVATDNPITLGADDVTFVQFSGAGSFEAGAGLLKTGNTVDVQSANDAIVVNADNIELVLADTSLEIVAGGLKISTGTAGQVLVADASGVPLAQTLSGDVATVGADGEVTLASFIPRKADIVVREVPTGSINGTNATFTLANTPVDGSESVFLNGLLLNGGGDDYSISNDVITMIAAPESGDRLLVTYVK